MKRAQFSAWLMLGLLCSQSFAIGKEGGGGDATEMGVDEVRSDLLKWIQAGGPKTLIFPPGLTVESYSEKMSRILAPHAVIVGFVTTAQERESSDPEQKVIVNNEFKSCRGFISKTDNLPHILCNSDRYPKDGSNQYRLIHHEYAGLAGVEKNIGASSDYVISEQITEYLVPETVYRLSVKSQAAAPSSAGRRADCYDLDSLQLAADKLKEIIDGEALSILRKKGIAVNPSDLGINVSTNTTDYEHASYFSPAIDGGLTTSSGTELIVLPAGSESTPWGYVPNGMPYYLPMRKSKGVDREGNPISSHCFMKYSSPLSGSNRYVTIQNSKSKVNLATFGLPLVFQVY